MYDVLNEEFSITDDIFSHFPRDPEISSLNAQMERRLNIDFNTQALQLKVEKVKRQKLSAKKK